MPPDWFKPVWCTLSTFGFAMTAWLVSRWFLVPAVQMSLTGMMMVRFPEHAYFIYGISWWIALHTVALALEKVRRKSIDRSKEESAKLYDLKRRSEVAEVAPLMSSRS